MDNFITPEYYKLITEEEAKFILEQAEKQLTNIVDTSDAFVSRLTTLMTVTATVLAALTGYIINRLDTHPLSDPLILTASFGLVYLFITAIILYRNLTPKPYFTSGLLPKELFIDRVFNDKNKTYRLIAIYVNEIEEHQKRILANKALNDRRWRQYTLALLLLVLTPIFLGAVYVLLTMVCRPLCH